MMTITEATRCTDWRRVLNQAVRQCVSNLDGLDGFDTAAAVRTMLAEIGKALAVDSAALIEFPEHARPATGHDWHRSPGLVSGGGVSALLSVIDQLKVERTPMVISEEGPDQGLVPGARTFLRRASLQSAAIVPAGVGLRPTCVWAFGVRRIGYDWADGLVDHLQILGDILAGALQRRSRSAPIENHGPVHRTTGPRPSDDIVGDSPALKAALQKLDEVANTESTVLLLGETGTGKELFARALHARGPRRASPLVSVNCGALPPTLIESELFGHQRGAFTGAVALRQGRFELAHRGTLFLDEIGDLPLDLQAKLLRVLQEGIFERVGSSHSHSVDVRIIAATHHDLMQGVAAGTFRADLYYRLNVFPIRLPPLRERREDIPALVWSIIRRRQQTMPRRVTRVPDDAMAVLQNHSWPGNVRELENVVERALIHSTGDTLVLLDGGPEAAEAPPVPTDGSTLVSVERSHIQEVLQACGWRINGLGNAAERLGLHPNTLRFRMKKLGIIRHESIRQRRPAYRAS